LDPSGHVECSALGTDADIAGCNAYKDQINNPYGINFSGSWTFDQRAITLQAAGLIERRLRSVDVSAAYAKATMLGESISDFSSLHQFSGPGQAWQAVFGSVTVDRIDPQDNNPAWGAETFGDRNTIEFYEAGFTVRELGFHIQHPLHEFGHLFAYHAATQQPYRDLNNAQITAAGFNIAGGGFGGGYVRTALGYRSGTVGNLPWQQSGRATPNEDFADMFLNWTLGSFVNSTLRPRGTAAGRARYRWMNANMPGWIALAVDGSQ
jgi:hypothetical protein